MSVDGEQSSVSEMQYLRTRLEAFQEEVTALQKKNKELAETKMLQPTSAQQKTVQAVKEEQMFNELEKKLQEAYERIEELQKYIRFFFLLVLL